MKRFLIILVTLCSTFIVKADELYKCTKDTVQLYNSQGQISFLKMFKDENVWIIEKNQTWISIRYSKTGSLFLIKPEDLD